LAKADSRSPKKVAHTKISTGYTSPAEGAEAGPSDSTSPAKQAEAGPSAPPKKKKKRKMVPARQVSPDEPSRESTVDVLDVISREASVSPPAPIRAGRAEVEEDKEEEEEEEEVVEEEKAQVEVSPKKGKARMEVSVELPSPARRREVVAPQRQAERGGDNELDDDDLAILDEVESEPSGAGSSRLPSPTGATRGPEPKRVMVAVPAASTSTGLMSAEGMDLAGKIRSTKRILSPDSDIESAPLGVQPTVNPTPVTVKAPPPVKKTKFELSPSPDPISRLGDDMEIERDIASVPTWKDEDDIDVQTAHAGGQKIEDQEEKPVQSSRLLFRPNRLDGMTREQWRALVERERTRTAPGGASAKPAANDNRSSLSPIDAELTPSNVLLSSPRTPTVSVDGVDFTVRASFNMGTQHYPIEIPASPEPVYGQGIEITPAQFRAPVRRHFETKTIDAYNRMLPQLTANPDLHRAMFQNWITEATAADEPYADEIRVYNEADKEAEAPDMEFEYSNGMLYDHDVPDPEIGTGCGCAGPCNPKSRTCSCVKRQKLFYYGEEMDGFAYKP
jgi:hypothetical protein